MTTYALPNDWELAAQRLELLEACHDATSFARAAALGVAPGWRCLEAGAGGGSVARWLARDVGADVLAVDVDDRLLSPSDGLEVRRLDLARDALPYDEFDFVHTRLVLLHIPARDAVLRRLVDALRPGGVILLEEDDLYPVLATATGAYREGWDAFEDIMRAGGTDAEWARGLPERLVSLGLDGVDAALDGQLFPGGSVPARFWSLTWQQVRDRGDAAALDRGRAALVDPDRWFHGPAKVSAWGRKP